MASTDVTGTLAQAGVYDRDAGTWVESGSLTLGEVARRVAGLRYTGFPAAERLPTAATLTLTFTPSAGNVPLLLDVYGVADAAPSAYSAANPPPGLDQVTRLSDLRLVDSQLVSSSGEQSLELSLDAAALDSILNWAGETWNGTLNLHVHARTADGQTLTLDGTAAPLVLTLDDDLFRGIDLPWGFESRSRVDICPICGDESLRETWIYCGFHNRLECADCADPDDIPRRSNAGAFRLVGED